MRIHSGTRNVNQDAEHGEQRGNYRGALDFLADGGPYALCKQRFEITEWKRVRASRTFQTVSPAPAPCCHAPLLYRIAPFRLLTFVGTELMRL